MLYSYRCPGGHQFDRLKPIARRDETEPCPQCGQPSCRQAATISRISVDLGRPPWANDWTRNEKRVFTVGGN